MKKFFSFITPTKNINRIDLLNLAKDINELQISIFPKTIEWIIVDHKSNKDDIAYVESLRDFIKFELKIFSFRKKYVPPAYNYGFDKAEGKWNLFIGHDDRILFKNLRLNLNIFEDNKEVHIISFPSLRIFKNKTFPLNPNRFLLLLKNTIPHPSTFINKNIKDFNGAYIYPENYIMTADYYFFLSSFLNSKVKFKLIKQPIITLHSAYGVSSDKELCVKEIMNIQDKLLGFSPYRIAKFLEKIKKKVFSKNYLIYLMKFIR